VVIFFKMMLSSHGEPSWMPNILADTLLDRDEFTEREYSDYFTAYGFPNSLIILTSGKKLFMLLMMLGSFPVVKMMDNRYSDKHKYCSIWKKIRAKFHYSLPLRTFLIAYVSLAVTLSMNMLECPLVTFEDNVSAIFAFVLGIICIYFPVQILHILQLNFLIIDTKEFISKYSSVIKELKTEHPVHYMYYPFFLCRRFLFGGTLAFFRDSPHI
jgi:hypothetical protein